MDNHNDNNLDTDLNPEDEKEGLKRLGSSLASARKKRNFHLEYISKETNISIKHLKFIEAGRFEELPGEAYITGFLRSYANILGSDPDLTIKNYRNCKAIKDQKPLAKIDSLTESSFSRNIFILVSVLFFFLAYGIWINFFYDSTKENFSDKMIDNSTEVIVTNYGNESSSSISEQAVDNQDNSNITIVDAEEESHKDLERSENLDQLNEDDNSFFSETIDQISQFELTSIEEKASNAYFSLKAVEDVWVELISEEEVIFSSLMESGRSYEFAILPDLRLTASDAASLEIYVDGVSQGELGEKGEILEKKIFE